MEEAKEIEKLKEEIKELKENNAMLKSTIFKQKIVIERKEETIKNQKALFKQLLEGWIEDLSQSGRNTKKKVREEMKVQLANLNGFIAFYETDKKIKEKTQMKTEELIGLEKELYPILEISQLSRDDDMKLYGNYVERQWQKKKVYTLAEYITEVMLNANFRKEQEIRPFCTVERVRRKLQEKYPEIRGKKYRPRNKEQETYKEYARESCYFKATNGDTDEKGH